MEESTPSQATKELQEIIEIGIDAIVAENIIPSKDTLCNIWIQSLEGKSKFLQQKIREQRKLLQEANKMITQVIQEFANISC